MSARINGKSALKEAVSPVQWEKNVRLAEGVVELINSHPIKNHELLKKLEDQSLRLDQLLLTHSEFKYTFSEIFTDLLLKLMLSSKCLQERVGNIDAVAAARFIIQINLLDELGYKPGVEEGDYIGDPKEAHFAQLRATMQSLNITESEYVPSRAAIKIRKLLECSTDIDLAVGAGLLFASEYLFPLFANTFARNLSVTSGHDIEEGFHSIHTDDEVGNNIEDDHAGDCLALLTVSVTSANVAAVKYYVQQFLNLVVEFCDNILEPANTGLSKSSIQKDLDLIADIL